MKTIQLSPIANRTPALAELNFQPGVRDGTYPGLVPLRQFWILAGLCLCLFVIGGCRTQRSTCQENDLPQPVFSNSASASPQFVANRPKRVVILHSGHGQPWKDFPRQLANAVAAECRSQGLFEVIVPHNLECATTLDEIQAGMFYEDELIRVARQHNADSVLLFRVNEFKFPYPMHASVTFVMIDPGEAIVTYSQDDVWNLGEIATNNNFDGFLRSRAGDNGETALQIQKQSPASFAAFIASQVAAAMSRAGRQ